MVKALGSKVCLTSNDYKIAMEFRTCIQDLFDSEEVKDLDNYTQHLNTSRLQHSINVSYYSYLICKKLGFDYRSAARGALLHDLFNYDWRVEKQPEGPHAIAHPKIALRNAKKLTNLNKIEEDCIINHMWPLTLKPPMYKESMIVSFVDKYCAVIEICNNILKTVFNKLGTINF